MNSSVMESTTTLVVEDVLASLLDEGTAGDLADLEIDPAQMPVAKSSVVYTVIIHC